MGETSNVSDYLDQLQSSVESLKDIQSGLMRVTQNFGVDARSDSPEPPDEAPGTYIFERLAYLENKIRRLSNDCIRLTALIEDITKNKSMISGGSTPNRSR